MDYSYVYVRKLYIQHAAGATSKLDTENPYALPPGMSRCHFSVPSVETSKRYS